MDALGECRNEILAYFKWLLNNSPNPIVSPFRANTTKKAPFSAFKIKKGGDSPRLQCKKKGFTMTKGFLQLMFVWLILKQVSWNAFQSRIAHCEEKTKLGKSPYLNFEKGENFE